MRIAIFDYKVTPTNPIGGCHRLILQGLAEEHDFTVFAAEFENPRPGRVDFVRIPVPQRPLALLFLSYHLAAPPAYWAHRLRTGKQYEIVQMVESNLSFGDVAYVHYCHRAFLRNRWKEMRARGIRGLLRYLDHLFHAWAEPIVFKRIKHIVVPSMGLKRELIDTYSFTNGKITLIPNPVDLDSMEPPREFDREGFRLKNGVRSQDIVMVFVALGHFERKGLHLVLEALRALGDSRVKLWVVGGTGDLVAVWKRRAISMGLAERVKFFGMQKDVRPFLWGADAFLLPTLYEVFPLVTLEAAASGLPLLVTRVYGVEEFVQDGSTGLVLERSPTGVSEGVRKFVSLPEHKRKEMGLRARQAVGGYSVDNFVEAWRRFFQERLGD